MSVSSEALRTWAAAGWQTLPEAPRALGTLTGPDGKPLLTLAFDTHRDIITSIGYQPGEACDEALRACAAALCSLAKDKAVMAADLLGPVEISAALQVEAEMDDPLFYSAVLAVLCLKNALSSYAETRAADYAAFKREQGQA